jgi:ABC-2 type transport system permease protein
LLQARVLAGELNREDAVQEQWGKLMSNVFLIIKHQIATTLRRRSFWLTTFLLPAFILALSIGSQALARTSLASGGSNPLLGGIMSAGKPIGYVDLAGIIEQIPEPPKSDNPLQATGPLQAYATEAAAQAALDGKEITKYYIVPADFIQSGNLVMVDSNFSIFNSLENNGYFEYVLRLNLVKDANLAELLDNPTAKVETEVLAPQGAKNDDSFNSMGVPFAVLMIFYLVITMTGGFMLQSVSKEKENRTIEVLLLSLRPRDLMLGKILGLGVVALLQIVVWGGVMLLFGGLSLGGLSSLGLPAGFFFWALLYFVLGYLLYASLLGALGALAPSTREGTQFTFLVLSPLFIPLMLNSVLVQTPNGALTVFLSLFPLTSPVTMIARLASAPVPIEQLVLGLIILAITTYGIIVYAARFFRADTLLSFSTLNFKRLLQEMRR